MLVTLAVLSLLWGAVLTTVRQSTSEATARLSRLRLEGALDGALASLAYDLSRPHATFDGTRHIQIGSISVEARIRPETAKVDLNDADPALISDLLHASGISGMTSDKLAHQIAEFRMHDPSAPQYASSNHHSGHLASLTDIVAGIRNGGDLVSCLGSDVTLFTNSPDVAIHWASDRVRRAAIAFNPQLYTRTSSALTSIVGGEASRPDIVEITQRAHDNATQIEITRQVVMRLTGNPDQLYWIISNRSPAPSAETSAAACERLGKEED